MTLGFALHRGCLDLARAEVDAVVKASGTFFGSLYVADVLYLPSFSRLAFTKAIYDVSFTDGGVHKKLIAGDLAKTNGFQSRRAHLLPVPYPAMTHPRVARAMVNLSGARREVLDPFCGGGGILIEAGLCGLHPVGFDIDFHALKRTQKNMEFVGVKDGVLRQQDATTFSGLHEAVVTDLPYGMNSKITDELSPLYFSFLKNLKKNKITRAVVGFPDFTDKPSGFDSLKLVRRAGFEVTGDFSYYLHRRLSKRILVLG